MPPEKPKLIDTKVRAILTYMMVVFTFLLGVAKIYFVAKGYKAAVSDVVDNVFVSFLSISSLLIGFYISQNK